jgi:glutaminase
MTRPRRAFVSTGALPDASLVASLVTETYERFATVDEGDVSTVYPALAEVEPDRFGICVVATSGRTYAAGDAEALFTIMSVAKPFVFALVSAERSAEEVRRRIGVNATGLPFNSSEAVGRGDGRTNPLVNPGAIATTSLTPGRSLEDRWAWLRDGLARFAGRSLEVDERVYDSASGSNHVNRELTRLLTERGVVAGDPADALELYTRQSSLTVTARDLATMAATLADGGVNPVTRERVVDQETCRWTLAVMTTAGLYETSGDWLCDVGLPGKSGIGGGIVTVAPGKGGLGTFSPRLDEAGNSVRGQLAARFLSRTLGLDVFASEPESSTAADSVSA